MGRYGPKFCGVTSISILSPSWAFGKRLRASREGDLIVLVDNVFDHQLLGERANRARLAVDFNAEIARGTDTFLGRLQQSLLDGLKQDFPVDTFLALKILHCYY